MDNQTPSGSRTSVEKRKSNTILNYISISKVKKENSDDTGSTTTDEITINTTISTELVNSGQESEGDASEPVQANTSNTKSTLLEDSSFDLGAYIGKAAEIDDATKYALLKNPWTPPSNYKFPYSIVTKSGKDNKKFAQRSHLNKFEWLVLSDKLGGYLCKFCVLFSDLAAADFRKVLTSSALTDFNSCLGKKGNLCVHEESYHHKEAVKAGNKFLSNYLENEVVNTVSAVQAQMMENRELLKPIIETLILCGRENIPLRGPTADDSIFKALLRYRVSAGDDNLGNHLRAADADSYTSKETQKKLIQCCKEEVQNIILSRVGNADAFAIIFYETTDIAEVEQLSLSFRYFYQNLIIEDFVTLIDEYQSASLKRRPRIALAHILQNFLKPFSLDLKKCVAIGTDSSSAISSEVKGVAQELLKKAENAKIFPCTNHVLNNSLAKSTTVLSCRNATGTIKKIIEFMKASTKREAVFQSESNEYLINFCEAPWGEKQFRYSLPKIYKALQTISKWQDNKTASEAYCLMQTIRCTEFLVSLVSLCDILGKTLFLSRQLQSTSLDYKKASDSLKQTKAVLEEKLRHADSHFKALFEDTTKIANELGVSMPSKDHETYKREIYIPLLESTLMDITNRFPEDVLKVFDIRVFVPKPNMANDQKNKDMVLSVARRYEKFLKAPASTILDEFAHWCQYWERTIKEKGKGALPSTLMEAIDVCDADENKHVYPKIRLMLIALANMPISVHTAERSASTMPRLKSWLRRPMEERLTGLSLLNIHRDIDIDVEKVIDRFSTPKK